MNAILCIACAGIIVIGVVASIVAMLHDGGAF